MIIIFLEDDQDDVFLLEHACRKVGINENVRFFANGRKAIEFLGPEMEKPVSILSRESLLIFVDLNMPEMNGLEFLRWARNQPPLRTTPVVILSTSENPRDIRASYESGANAYLVKASTISELTKMLEVTHAFWIQYNRYAPA